MRVQRVIVQEEVPKKKKSSSKEKPLIHIIIILDRSGSMDDMKWINSETKYVNAVKGINQEIETLKGDNTTDYLITIIEFDQSNGTRIEIRYDKVPLEEVAEFRGLGAYGGTPLYETVGIALEKYMKSVGKEKTLVKVFTDGGENASQGVWKGINGANLLKSTIAIAEAKGFTVTFIGTEKDVKDMINFAGFRAGNTMSYNGTASGMKRSMRAAIGDTIAYSGKVSRGEAVTDNFFSKSMAEEEEN